MEGKNEHLGEIHIFKNIDGTTNKQNHEVLVGAHGQVIRLKENFFGKIKEILENKKEVVLFNIQNPKNDWLISQFELQKNHQNFYGKVTKIIQQTNKGPILEEYSLFDIQIISMQNIGYGNIKDDVIKNSLMWHYREKTHKNIQESLINWMEKKLYENTKITQEDIKEKGLFLRKIRLKNNNNKNEY